MNPPRFLTAAAWRRLQAWDGFSTLRTFVLRFREDRIALTAGGLTFASLISAVPLTWAWQPLDSHQLGLLLVIGLLATVSQIVMSKAYGLAPPGLIGPFAYLAIVFAGVIAWLRWGETPDLSSLIGAALIFASSLLSIARRPTAR